MSIAVRRKCFRREVINTDSTDGNIIMASEIQVSHDLTLSALGCAFHHPTGALMVADLHIGYEAALEDEGFAMPRFQSKEMLSRIGKAIDRFDPALLVVDGDLKHNFDRNLTAEWNDVEKFVDEVSKRCKLVVIRGNHDNFLATILSKRGIHIKKEVLLGNVKIAHGHETAEPWKGGMVLAHEHPAIRLIETTGASVKIPCFLLDRESNRLVLPAFSPFAIGSDVIGTPDGERMIPLLSETGIQGYVAYGFAHGEILNCRSVGALRAIDGI
jgi:putative SbcD/Mre11-related phosphoesterase